MKMRLDALLVERGLAEDKDSAQRLVLVGEVRSGDTALTQPAALLDPSIDLKLKSTGQVFVSRGGDKLAGALEDFTFVARSLNCLDVGASTGGFTDCLLQQGAAHVSSVDVGYGQFAWQLRTDGRVSLFERTNIKDVDADLLSRAPFELVVVDLSFISLRAILARLAPLLASDGTLIALVKPQFELARGSVGKGGVVTDAKAHEEALSLVIAAAQAAGLAPLAATHSHLKGPKGNIEFFLRAQKGGFPVTIDTAELVQKAHAHLS